MPASSRCPCQFSRVRILQVLILQNCNLATYWFYVPARSDPPDPPNWWGSLSGPLPIGVVEYATATECLTSHALPTPTSGAIKGCVNTGSCAYILLLALNRRERESVNPILMLDAGAWSGCVLACEAAPADFL